MVKVSPAEIEKGPILKNLIIFALPLLIMNVVQILFNTIDVAIIGIFEDDASVTAVGSNGPIIGVITSLFIGMSVASNILISRAFGAKDEERIGKLVGTSIYLSLITGVILMTLGLLIAKPLLVITDCLPEVLPLAELYLKIYFLGIPALTIYNFGSAILRASGDTFHPMLYIIIGGVINLFGNVILVAVFKMGVSGVAIATVASQIFSAIAVLITVIKQKGPSKLQKQYFHLYKTEVKEIIFIGIPCGIQSSLFGISNLVINTVKNSFGLDFVTAFTISVNYDNLCAVMFDSISVASLTFMSQFYGSKDLQRLKKTVYLTIVLSVVVGAILSAVLLPFAGLVFSIMTKSSEVVKIAVSRSSFMTPIYCIIGFMYTTCNVLKAFGKSTTSLIIGIVFTCLFRIVYVETIMKIYRTYLALYIVYPLSWLLTGIVAGVFAVVLLRKQKKKISEFN